MFENEQNRRSNLTERLLHLRGFPLFADLPPRVLQAIAMAATERTFDPGDRLLSRGMPYEHAVLVTRGEVAVSVPGAEPDPLPSKPCVGVMGLLARTECEHDIVALSETRGLVLTGDALLDLMEEHSPLLRAMTHHLAGLAADLEKERPEEVSFGASQDASMMGASAPVSSEPLNPIERISFLRELPSFGRTNLASLMTLSRLLREVRLDPGVTLWKVGDVAETNLTLIQGEIVGVLPDGRRLRFRPGSSTGGIEGLANRPRWYDAVTQTPVVALEGRTEEFVALLEDDFAMAMAFLGEFAGALLSQLGLMIEPRRPSERKTLAATPPRSPSSSR